MKAFTRKMQLGQFKDDPRYLKTVRQLLESQAYRESMAAHLFGHALKYVPELRYKKVVASQIAEELEHYEDTVKLYGGLGGNLEALVTDQLATGKKQVPLAESWLELGVAQFLFDRAGEFQLSLYRNCSYSPYARIVGKILEEEEEHEGFGEQVVKQFCKDKRKRPLAQKFFNKWFGVSLLSFGRPDSAANRYAVRVGLKNKESGEVMQDYINDIKPVMRECGLKFPPKNRIGAELPKGIDLAL
ncbi:MAG: phenylacetate-CoA oxygenase subunit PaaI [Deltaproteobacteria bacterium]|nr:phenylacetate-CoA oxygenase subunit PaaI [Deltaproteobacteria bacterium]